MINISILISLCWSSPSDKTRLWYRDEQQQNKLWFEVGTEVVSLKAFSKSSQTGMRATPHDTGVTNVTSIHDANVCLLHQAPTSAQKTMAAVSICVLLPQEVAHADVVMITPL